MSQQYIAVFTITRSLKWAHSLWFWTKLRVLKDSIGQQPKILPEYNDIAMGTDGCRTDAELDGVLEIFFRLIFLWRSRQSLKFFNLAWQVKCQQKSKFVFLDLPPISLFCLRVKRTDLQVSRSFTLKKLMHFLKTYKIIFIFKTN